MGSTLTKNRSADKDIETRIQKANKAFSCLWHRVWNVKTIHLDTKLAVYKATVVPVLLYGSETWTLYRYQRKKLESFHHRCLRTILNVNWHQYIADHKVVEMSKLPSIHAMLLKRRLQWFGHISRMEDNRIPKQVCYGQISEGNRRKGRPDKRWKDNIKEDIKKSGLSENPTSPNNWKMLENSFQDRPAWRKSTFEGSKYLDLNWFSDETERHKKRRRKERSKCRLNRHGYIVCPECNATYLTLNAFRLHKARCHQRKKNS